jgi:hypothetical protein
MRTLKNQKLQHERWCFFPPSVYLICFVIGLMRPPVRSSPSSARSPNHEISSGSAKCCKESTAAAKDKNAGPFSEIQHTTPANIRGNQMANNGVLSSRSVVKTTREREKEHFNTSLIAHQKRQTKESRR